MRGERGAVSDDVFVDRFSNSDSDVPVEWLEPIRFRSVVAVLVSVLSVLATAGAVPVQVLTSYRAAACLLMLPENAPIQAWALSLAGAGGLLLIMAFTIARERVDARRVFWSQIGLLSVVSCFAIPLVLGASLTWVASESSAACRIPEGAAAGILIAAVWPIASAIAVGCVVVFGGLRRTAAIAVSTGAYAVPAAVVVVVDWIVAVPAL
jgi:hypothetical protein